MGNCTTTRPIKPHLGDLDEGLFLDSRSENPMENFDGQLSDLYLSNLASPKSDIETRQDIEKHLKSLNKEELVSYIMKMKERESQASPRGEVASHHNSDYYQISSPPIQHIRGGVRSEVNSQDSEGRKYKNIFTKIKELKQAKMVKRGTETSAKKSEERKLHFKTTRTNFFRRNTEVTHKKSERKPILQKKTKKNGTPRFGKVKKSMVKKLPKNLFRRQPRIPKQIKQVKTREFNHKEIRKGEKQELIVPSEPSLSQQKNSSLLTFGDEEEWKPTSKETFHEAVDGQAQVSKEQSPLHN
ncbi:unnamed protein product [Moneuplotes crassus]|uniref:Uncharacterized protein n=1 Tax=Euplotes crassus TaxID=5936 RepID=A0AAD1XFS7_EUPCR|nr:unnamed protein product [Moneuplotes crassus]